MMRDDPGAIQQSARDAAFAADEVESGTSDFKALFDFGLVPAELL
jgi:hypothetical protein